MAKRQKQVPLILGVVFNPEHPAVAKLLAESGVNPTSLASAGLGAIVQVPPVALEAPPRVQKTPRRIVRAERGTPQEHAALILDAFTDPGVALSVGQVSDITKLTPSQAKRGLNALRETGQIFMAGDKRFARYGLTPEAAEAEAIRGRDLHESVQLHRPIRPRSRIVPEEGPGI